MLILAQDKNTEGEENMQCNVVHPQTLIGDQKGPIVRMVNLIKCEDPPVNIWNRIKAQSVKKTCYEAPVNIWDLCDTKSPVEGGARSSVEETWDAANLTLENINIEKGKVTVVSNLVVFLMDCIKGIVASDCKVIHCIVARSWGISVAPEDKEWLLYNPSR